MHKGDRQPRRRSSPRPAGSALDVTATKDHRITIECVALALRSSCARTLSCLSANNMPNAAAASPCLVQRQDCTSCVKFQLAFEQLLFVLLAACDSIVYM